MISPDRLSPLIPALGTDLIKASESKMGDNHSSASMEEIRMSGENNLVTPRLPEEAMKSHSFETPRPVHQSPIPCIAVKHEEIAEDLKTKIEEGKRDKPEGLLKKFDRLIVSGIENLEKILSTKPQDKKVESPESYSPKYASAQRSSAEIRRNSAEKYATQDYVTDQPVIPIKDALKKKRTTIIQPMLTDLHTINQMTIEDSPLENIRKGRLHRQASISDYREVSHHCSSPQSKVQSRQDEKPKTAVKLSQGSIIDSQGQTSRKRRLMLLDDAACSDINFNKRESAEFGSVGRVSVGRASNGRNSVLRDAQGRNSGLGHHSSSKVDPRIYFSMGSINGTPAL